MTCKTQDVSSKREQLESAGEWLRRTREKRGYKTLAEFARALGVDQSLVSRYERGASEVSTERAERIAEVLRMDEVEVRRNLGLWVEPKHRRSPDIPTADHQVARELLTHIIRALDNDNPLPAVPSRPPSDWDYPDDPGLQLIHENPYLDIGEKVAAINFILDLRDQQQRQRQRERRRAEPAREEEPPEEKRRGA